MERYARLVADCTVQSQGVHHHRVVQVGGVHAHVLLRGRGRYRVMQADGLVPYMLLMGRVVKR